MSPESIIRFVSEIQESFPACLRTEDAGRTLIRLQNVSFPAGCAPAATEALAVLEPGQPKPRLLVKHKPKTPRGMVPRNVNAEAIGGESWFSFSYNIAWDEARHTAQQFVEGAMGRFAKDE